MNYPTPIKLQTVFAALTLASGATAATFTNSVSADAFVRADAATLNYGGAGGLSVSGSAATNASGIANGVFDTFIRFNTAGMVAHFDSLFGPANWEVSGAALRVTEQGASNNALFNRGVGAFEILWIANDGWMEGTGNPNAPTTTGITYNDVASLLNPGADASLGTSTNAGMDGSLSFPLTLPPAFVDDLRAGGEVGLYLTAVDAGVGFTFTSRNFGTASARPYLEVSALPRPGITSIALSGADVVLAATNGAAGATYHVLSSTNVALPLAQWLPVATNVLDSEGAFSVTVTNAASADASALKFFILRTH
ncbi:MAG: hypothetical protein IT579_04730 [Verrucomicrobia subdivision 3 bacterium]|nr:hypothetical protein [Limisphaerales bacterium]